MILCGEMSTDPPPFDTCSILYNGRREIGEISYFIVMRIIKNPSLLHHYLTSPPYTDYFRNDLRAYTRILEYDPGEYVLRQSVPPDHLYLMLHGRCCTRASLTNGKSMILQTLKAPCLIGEMELLQDISPLTVQVLEKSRMLAIPLERCRPILLQDPGFLRRVCSELIIKERANSLSLIHTFCYPLENRLAKFILDNRQENRFYIKKTHIAESLGASYRHVQTVMGSFVRKGYLTKEKLVYTLADESALSALARELDAFDAADLPLPS